ncbi:MAG: sensor histidine kinase [Butyricicoccus sp.]
MKKLLVACTLSLSGGILWGVIAAWILAQELFQSQAQLVSALPISDSVYEALHKAAGLTDITGGEALLRRGGYTPEFYFWENVVWLCMLTVGLFVLLSAVILLWSVVRQKTRRTRLAAMTQYLTAVLEKREHILVRQEDEFSQLEDEIYKTVSELNLTREQAVQERQTLADNLADIAHQIKTPLTSMRLLTELLCGQTPEDALCLERLHTQMERLETLVAAILTLSRLDAGAILLRCENVLLYDIVLRAAEPIDAQLCRMGIDLKIDVPQDIVLSLDAMWTAEALLNILKNCAEHTPSGGSITVYASQNPIYTTLRITDSGAGFAQEDLPHLFERFYQGKKSQTGGIGIGLALTKAILQIQNAEIDADCARTGGAQFTIHFYKTNHCQ